MQKKNLEKPYLLLTVAQTETTIKDKIHYGEFKQNYSKDAEKNRVWNTLQIRVLKDMPEDGKGRKKSKFILD